MPESSDDRLRHPALWSAIGWGFVALVVYLSLAPAPQVVDTRIFNAGHLIAYAWLMLWFAQIHRLRDLRMRIGGMLCIMGVAIEYAQGLSGYRTFDYTDMGMNTLGVFIGLLLADTKLQYALHALERRLPR